MSTMFAVIHTAFALAIGFCLPRLEGELVFLTWRGRLEIDVRYLWASIGLLEAGTAWCLWIS